MVRAIEAPDTPEEIGLLDVAANSSGRRLSHGRKVLSSDDLVESTVDGSTSIPFCPSRRIWQDDWRGWSAFTKAYGHRFKRLVTTSL